MRWVPRWREQRISRWGRDNCRGRCLEEAAPVGPVSCSQCRHCPGKACCWVCGWWERGRSAGAGGLGGRGRCRAARRGSRMMEAEEGPAGPSLA